jgi:uncharacterized protein (UPF0305 family)
MSIWNFSFGKYQTKEFYKNKEQFINDLASKINRKKSKEIAILKEIKKKEINNNIFVLDINSLTLIFNSLCKHKPTYNKGKDFNSNFKWKDCNDCILRNIPDRDKDLCFSIWHNGILNNNKNANI